MDYLKTFNDYELVYQVREKDEVAYDILIKKYSPLIAKIARKYLKNNNYIGLEYEDLYQEGMVGLLRALSDYDSADSLFYTYALICITRQIETCVKTNSREKHSTLNNAISFNTPVYDNDLYLEDVISSPFNMEDDCIANDLYNKINDLKHNFEFTDSLILELKINSFSISEIATLLDLNKRSVDYRLRRIRKKLVQDM